MKRRNSTTLAMDNKNPIRPLVSVIITNYNYGEYINQAIESVLDQSYKNIELIVIDDGSTDNSLQIIEKYVKKNSEIIFIKQKNHGVVYTRNKGMERASGEYICCLDADDFFDPDYIEKQYRYITQFKADVVYPNWNLFGDINQKLYFPEFDFVEYQKQHFHIKPESLVRASAIKHANGKLKHGYLPETKQRANDWAYFISLAANGLKFKLANDNYVNYRIKKGSMGNRFTRYEDIAIFYTYLGMLKRRYGDKIIEPVDLPIDIIRQQDEYIKKLNRHLHDKDMQIDGMKEEFSEKVNELQRVNDELQRSLSWRVTKPLRVVNTFLHKRS
jgi:glycosyltransferase involved in cell wall biosynthesis